MPADQGLDRVALPPPADFAAHALIGSLEQYQEMYQESIEDPDGFWLKQAETLDWFKMPTKGRDYTWDTENRVIDIKWFEDGKLNVAYNCLDRHLGTSRKNKAAIIWQGEPEEDVQDSHLPGLHREVSKFANVLKSKGVQKGDRVAIYMPMIPELAIAMLACTRIGAIHSVVFGGIQRRLAGQPHSRLGLQGADHQQRVAARGSQGIPLKATCDEALPVLPQRHHADRCQAHARRRANGRRPRLVVARGDGYCLAQVPGRGHERRGPAVHPLHLRLHRRAQGRACTRTGGYLTYAAVTHKYIFDIHDEDTYWCTADCGWITGHTYIVYGPLANGATVLMFEGVPDLSRRQPLLAGGGKVPGQHLLHRADRHPLAAAPGRSIG